MIGCGMLIALSAMAPAGEQARGAGGPMRIVLDAFSGRENPTWTLGDEQSREFATTFDSLGEGDPARRIEDGLGYRGFKVTGFRDYDELTVWKGVVQATRAGKVVRRNDKGRGLERFLLKTSKAHLDEAVYKYVASEVEKD
jgi:hypothetical protein